jgi:peptide/nickel transport system permease protein
MTTLEELSRGRELKPVNPIVDKFRQMAHNKFALVGMTILTLLALIAIFAPVVAPYDPIEMDLTNSLQPPNSEHPLGTDKLGRDVLSRLIYGSRISLTVGFIVVGIALSVGVTLGAIAGYFGGIIDNIIMRIVDVVIAFPFLILAIAIVAIVGPSLTNMMLVLGGVAWIDYARIIRGMFLSLKEEEFVVAARVIGVKDRRIIFRHILPSTVGVIIVQATFGIAASILAASSLSFLGMGAQPPTPEWGAMLSEANAYLRKLPMMTFAPGLAIMITVLAINFVGDALRDAFDPRVLKV